MMDSNVLKYGGHKCINGDGGHEKPLKPPICYVFLELDSYITLIMLFDGLDEIGAPDVGS